MRHLPKGADAPKYWLDITKAPCEGHKAIGSEAHRNRLANILGVDRLEGRVLGRTPHTSPSGVGWARVHLLQVPQSLLVPRWGQVATRP